MTVLSRFSDRAESYAKHRPSYPAEAVDFVVGTLGLEPGRAVAELGSGTGIFTQLLLDRGLRVFAVEPNANMRAAAEAGLAMREGFVSSPGTAEDTRLGAGSVDAVVAAQAFHWFEPEGARRECQRILGARDAPSTVALVWNARRASGTAFLEGYEHLLLEHAVDYAAVRHQGVEASGALETFFRGPCARWSTPSAQVFDWEGLRGRAASSSYVPAEGHPAHATFERELRALFERTADADRVTFTYDVQVHHGRV